MSDSTVTIAVDAKHAAAIQAFVAIQQAMNTTTTSADKLGGRFAKAGDDSGKSWDKGLQILGSYPAAMLKMVTGTGAVLAITAQLRAEYERMGQLREKALGFFDQIREPAQRAELSFEPGFSSTELYKASVNRMINKGGNAAGVFDLLGNMASARGNVSQSDTLKAAELVSELMGKQGLSGEDSRQLGGALLDAMNAEIDNGGQPDPREILGSFVSSFGASRSTRMGDFARYDMRFINTAMRSHGFSRAEAVGLQSAVGGAIPDPSGRRTSTANMLLLQKLSEAYRTVDVYGAGIPGMSAEQFEKSGMKMIDIASSDSETGRHLRAYLMGINSDEQAVKDLAALYGGSMTFGGHYQGEAGSFQIVKNLLTPGGKGGILERARTATGTVRSGDAARALTADVLEGPLTSEQQKLYAARAAQKGALESARYQNTLQARRGSLAEFVEEAGGLAGTSDLTQKWRNIAGQLSSSGKGGTDLANAEIAAARQFIEDIVYNEPQVGRFKGLGLSEYNAKYDEWMAQRHPELERRSDGTALGGLRRFALGRFPRDMSLQREFREEKLLSDEERLQVEAFRGFIRQSEANRTRSGSATTGVSSEIGALAAAITAQIGTGGAFQFDIGVDDKSGRPLSRATSRSTGIETLND